MSAAATAQTAVQATAQTISDTTPALAGSGETLLGMASLGKMAGALALVIVVILLCTALLKRWNGTAQRGAGRHLRVVASTPLGSRERAVIVQINDTWLVLGVGGGQVTKLHECPAPDTPDPTTDGTPFARRLASALRPAATRPTGAPGDSISKKRP